MEKQLEKMKQYFTKKLNFDEVAVDKVPFDGDKRATRYFALKHKESDYSLVVYDEQDGEGVQYEMYGFGDASIGKYITYFLHRERIENLSSFADFIKDMDKEVA